MALFSMFKLLAQDPSPGSVMICYGDINPDKIRGFKYVIVESEHYTAFDIKLLKENNQTVLGYISLGEVSGTRYYYESIKDKTLGKNKNWNSYYLDLTDQSTKDAVLGLVSRIKQKGFDGLFLDTVDTFSEWGPYPERAGELIKMLALIKELHPNFYLMQNAGLSLVPQSRPYVNAIAVESTASDYSFEKDHYQLRKSSDFYQRLATLKTIKSKHNLPIILIEYANDTKLHARIRYEIAPLKWDFFIGQIGLEDLPKFKK